MLNTLTTSGHQPYLHILDNEASSSIRQGFLKNKIKYQLVPPHLHRRNANERAIQTFKANFITCLCASDPGYPAKEWDRFLPQAMLTLNLLHNCRFSPNLSAHAALHGIVDYNKIPLSPPETRFLFHDKTNKRFTWGSRGTDGWYIGPYL